LHAGHGQRAVTHPVQLCGAAFAGTRTGEKDQPTVLRFLQPDFVPALLRQLPTEAGRARLAALVQRPRPPPSGPAPPPPPAPVRPARPGEPMVLDRPVHRGFNLVVMDASCLVP